MRLRVLGTGDRVLVSECEEVLGFWRRRRSWIIGDMGGGGGGVGEGNGEWCWVWWLLGNMGLECGGFGRRRGRATFSAIGDRHKHTERDWFYFYFMKLGEVDTLDVGVFKLQPQRKEKDLLVGGQSDKEDLGLCLECLIAFE